MTGGTEYGKALFMLTEERGTTDAVLPDIKAAEKIFSDNRDYVKLLDTPALSHDEKHRIITEAFGGLDHLLVNLIKMLSDKGLFFGFERLHKSYCSLYDEHFGIERAEAVTARPLSEMQSLALCEKLEKITGKRIILTNTLDPDILGGIRITYSGVQLDGSLKRRLCDIEKGLKNTII